jgi:hypothetical protein
MPFCHFPENNVIAEWVNNPLSLFQARTPREGRFFVCAARQRVCEPWISGISIKSPEKRGTLSFPRNNNREGEVADVLPRRKETSFAIPFYMNASQGSSTRSQRRSTL